ncbi:quinon protein alcohol dehydrogenase-like superfamily [Mycena sp. CBHHK59/15]|nr:quinon protein alcohol dehydrogenase-like superfamily [Mycena sp. CBHHK59/15]
MNTPPSPASGASTRILEAILPALSLAKASVTGIGIPGVEPVINGVLELARMIATMKANKEDLSKLETSLKALIAIDASGASDDLKRRLATLQSKSTEIAVECKSLEEKNGVKHFFKSRKYEGKILSIRNSVVSHVQEFTFYGNISIEKLVGDMVSKDIVDEKIDNVLAKKILARVTCVPARYNAENTPEKCMVGTRVDIINDIVTQLTGPPDLSRRLVMLSGSAGSGKSTIAKSVASILAEEKHILAASFFFSRDYADRKEIKLLPSTIARQLADYNADFRHLLVKFLDSDCTGILSAEPRLQFQQLVVELLVQMPPSPTPWIICLDALDECGKDRGQVFLRWLSDSITHMPTHVRFFLTGRPDVPSYLKLDILHSLMHEIILDQIDRSTVERDIHLYVERSLDGTIWTPRNRWKAEANDVDEITKRAGQLFIFAATAVRYVQSGEALGAPFEGHTDWVTSVAFSPDGKHIISGSYNQTVRVWDAESGEALGALFKGHTHAVTSVAFSPDGKHIVSGSYDQTVRVWDAESGEALRAPFEGHTDWVTSVAFSPDGKHIVSGSDDRTVRVWDAESGEALGAPFEGHTDRVTSVAFSPDGKYIVSGSHDQTVHVWDAESGEALGAPFKGHTHAVTSVAFSPDGKHIVSGSYDQTVRVWDAESGEALRALFEGHTNQVTSVAFSPDGKHIVSGSNNLTVCVWDAESGEALGAPFEGHTNSVTSVAFSPDGKHIVSGSHDRTVRVWDAESGEALGAPFEGHTDWVTSAAFSPDGKHIISGSYDQTVRVWDAESGEALGAPFEGHTDWVTSVAFSPDGKHIVSGSHDRTVRVWGAESGEALGAPFEGHTDWVTSVAFSPDGKHIVSGSNDLTVRVWDAESGEALGAPFEGYTHGVTSVVFSPDGKHIVSGSHDRTVRVWDAESGEALGAPFEGHIHAVTSVAFSPDGKHIVSSSRDRTVRVWDAESGEALAAPFQGDRDQSRLILLNVGIYFLYFSHNSWLFTCPSSDPPQ